MSVCRTLQLRGPDPIKTISDALGIFIATGKLPSFPSAESPVDFSRCNHPVFSNAISIAGAKTMLAWRGFSYTARGIYVLSILVTQDG